MFISRRVPTALQVLTLTSGINLFAANVPVKLVCSMKDDNYICTFCCRAQIHRRDAAFMTSTISVLFPRTDVYSQLSVTFASTLLGMCRSNMDDTSPCKHCNQRTHRDKVHLCRTCTPTEGMSRSRESKIKDIQTANVIVFCNTQLQFSTTQLHRMGQNTNTFLFFLTVDSSNLKSRIKSIRCQAESPTCLADDCNTGLWANHRYFAPDKQTNFKKPVSRSTGIR